MAARKVEKENKEVSAEIQRLFDARHQKKISESFRMGKKRVMRLGMAVGALLLVALYFALPISNIRNISINGNDYLSTAYVKEISGLRDSSKFYLNIPVLISHRLENDPLIEKADVVLKNGNRVEITIQEKKVIGYRYEDVPVILFSDGTKTELQSSFLDIIARVPMITGFEGEEQTNMLVKAFANVERSVIEDMAEVDQYNVGYDTQSIRVLMRNGGYFIAGYNSLQSINHYNQLASQLKDSSQCILVDDGFKAAYTKTCPWNEAPAAAEYWLDEDGNVRINSDGVQAVKHYYVLSDGAFAHDGNGNRIVIPVNENADDVMDADFEEHYRAGYYESGVLQIPVEEWEPESDEEEG